MSGQSAEPGARNSTPDSLKLLLNNAFLAFDVDKSGKLSAAEMMGILTRSGGGRPLSRKDAQQIISTFDVNGDGQLDLGEFINVCRCLPLDCLPRTNTRTPPQPADLRLPCSLARHLPTRLVSWD